MSSTSQALPRLSGFMPAVPTPFTTEDRIDFAAFARFCDLQIRAGATALVVCGTTGESPTLSEQEQRELILAARDVARGRVPLIAGAGSNATAHAIALSRAAEAAGADALLSAVPYYNKPTQAGIQAHFTAIANAVEVPIILYDVPSRTVVGLADATVARLAKHPQIVGLKDATGDISRCGRLRSLVGDDFRLLSGDDATAPAFVGQGGNGCISVTSNIAPGLCRDLFDALTAGRLGDAHRLSKCFVTLTAALARSVNPVPVKYALSLFGLMSPDVRLPLVQLGRADQRELAAVCKTLTQFAANLSIAPPSEWGEVKEPVSLAPTP
jgi:4-hydroxy-tetrahydrodipicolinate synthase